MVAQTPDGQPLTTLSITPIPADRPPFPAPNGWHYTFVFQTHGSKVQSLHGQESQIQVTFPNSYVRTNRQVSLWAYDAAGRGWYTYDEADVSPDESKFISSGRHGLKRLACASLAGNSNLPVPAARDGAHDGDPVDLSTGLFIYRKTDLALPDTVPIALTRVYRQKDNAIRSFGVGATMNYDLFLAMDAAANWNSVILALPDGQQVVFNTLTNPPGPYGGAWQHVGEPAEFDQATLVYGGADATLADDRFWTMRLKDGSFLYFHHHGAMLSGITDRFGNSLTIDRFSRPGVTRITSPNGRWVDLTYAGAYVTQAKDSIGRTVSYTYDLNSRLSKVTDAAGGVTTYTYDTANDMLTITDPRNITYLTNQYNAQGLLSQQTQADNGVYQFAYTIDPSSNVIQTNVTDPLNIVRQVTFDSFGKMATDTHATGLPEQQVFTVNREPGTERLLSTVDALNRQTSYSYDGSGNLAGITELAGTPNAVTTTFAYEPVFNQLTSVTDALNHTTTFGYDSKGDLTTVTDPLQHQTTRTYNADGTLASITDANQNTTQFGYDSGDLISVTDGNGHAVTQFTDAAGRVVSRTDALGNTTKIAYTPLNLVSQIIDPQQSVTAFTYDGNGNLLTLTDALNHTTTYTYDSMDRLATRTDPLTRQESYSYDLDGNLTLFTDRKNQVTSFGYDRLNRRTFAGFGTVAGTPPTYQSTINYTYDAGDRLTQAADSVSGNIVRGYDLFDRVTSETTPQGSISYTYDAIGRRATMTVAGQPQVTYSYDSADRLTRIAQGTNTVAFGYDSGDRRTTLTLPNGIVTNYSYDNASQLTALSYELGGNTLGNLTYVYDNAGRKTQIGGSFARTGLPVGMGSATYDAANELTNWDATVLRYDNNGSLANDGGNTYSWDARNQLASISGSVNASFGYDAFGRRIGRNSTSFLYDGVNSVQELAGGSPMANILIGGVDENFLRSDISGTRSFLSDALGSTTALADSTGTVQTQYTYEPFGNTSLTGVADSNSAQYTARENDGTGLYYYRARYFDPQTQRFISEDPSEFEGGDLDFYSYVGNEPTGFIDPTGLDGILINYDWYPVATPLGHIPLGHGAVIAVDPRTGAMRYFEYGRYDSDFGQVKERPVPRLDMGLDGRPTDESLQHLYKYISDRYGHHSHVTATYYRDADYKRIIGFALRTMRDKHRKPYSLFGRNCKTFARDAIAAGRRP